MTVSEQVSALQRFGYTTREASFLATVALHSGYFVMRQFASKGGKVASQFVDKVVHCQHVSAVKFVSNASLYHLKSKAVYRALRQENNRHRRAHDVGQVRLKVLGLDYVLAHPDFRFLPTEDQKLAYFCDERSIPKSVLPTKTYLGKGSSTQRFFVDKFPIHIHPETGKVAFCFIDDTPFTLIGFDTWLAQYDALIRAIGHAEVVFVSSNPANFESARRLFEMQFSTISGARPADLVAYFELRKQLEATEFRDGSVAVLDRFKKLRKAFGDAHFEDQYLAWLSGKATIKTNASVAFSTYHLEHSCRFYQVKTKPVPKRGE